MFNKTSFDTYINSCNHHPEQDIEHFQTPQVPLEVPPSYHSPTPKGNDWSDFYHSSLAFPLLDLTYILLNHTQCTLLYLLLLLRLILSFSFIHVFVCIRSSFCFSVELHSVVGFYHNLFFTCWWTLGLFSVCFFLESCYEHFCASLFVVMCCHFIFSIYLGVELLGSREINLTL